MSKLEPRFFKVRRIILGAQKRPRGAREAREEGAKTLEEDGERVVQETLREHEQTTRDLQDRGDEDEDRGEEDLQLLRGKDAREKIEEEERQDKYDSEQQHQLWRN